MTDKEESSTAKFLERIFEEKDRKAKEEREQRLKSMSNPANYVPYRETIHELIDRAWNEAHNQTTEYDPSTIGEQMQSCVIDPQKDYPKPAAIVLCRDVPIMTRGNISTVIGNPGTRKSWFCMALSAVVLNNRPSGILSCQEPGQVLYIDTEQGEAMSARFFRIVKRTCGQDRPALHVLSLKQITTPFQVLHVIGHAIDTYRPDMVIVDGLADCIYNVNDIAESVSIVRVMGAIADRYNCHITSVIHSNHKLKEAQDGRGHLGSEAMRKVECELSLSLDVLNESTTNIHFNKNPRASKAPHDFTLHIEDSSEGARPVLGEQTTPPPTTKMLEHFNTIVEILQGSEKRMRHNELLAAFMERTSKGETAAKKAIKKALQSGHIDQDDRGLYFVVTSA